MAPQYHHIYSMYQNRACIILQSIRTGSLINMDNATRVWETLHTMTCVGSPNILVKTVIVVGMSCFFANGVITSKKFSLLDTPTNSICTGRSVQCLQPPLSEAFGKGSVCARLDKGQESTSYKMTCWDKGGTGETKYNQSSKLGNTSVLKHSSLPLPVLL